MSEAFQVPVLGWEIPKPKFWDWVAIAVAVVSVFVAIWGLAAARSLAPGTSFSSWLVGLWTMAQLAISIVGLLVLGKTAKEGTIHGNIAAVVASLLGLNGIFLAAALASIG